MAITVVTWAGIWLGILATMVLVVSIGGFLFPTRYEIFENHLSVETIFGSQKRAWSSLRRADAGERGVHLSPFRARSRLDGTRGIYIRFDGNRDEVLAAVGERLEAAHERMSASEDAAVHTGSVELKESGAR